MWASALFAISVIQPATAMEVYDSFDSRLLQPTRWNSGWISPHALDVQRYVDNGSLRLRLLGVGTKSAESGRTVSLNDIAFLDDTAVALRSVEMTAVLNKAHAKNCSVDGTPTFARLRHWGRWFNDGSSTAPDDETGDFHSFIEIRNVAGRVQNEIRFYAYRCLDSACATFESPITGSTWLDDVPVGTLVKLKTTINEAAGTIKFKANVKNQAPVSRTFDFSAMASIVKPPSTPGYAHVIQARVDAANCNVPERKLPTGLIDASIQKVRIQRATQASESTGDGMPDTVTTDSAPEVDDGPPVFAPVSSTGSDSGS